MREARILYLFAILPACIVGSFFVAGHVPDRWRNLFILAALAAALTIIVTIPVREALRRERMDGLVPRRSGFSGKLELIAETLREHARAIEQDTFAGFPSTFAAYVAEVRRVAQAQDRRTIFEGLRLDFDVDDAPKHVAALRRAAEEAELYAHELRGRGGMFKLSLYERAIGVALLLAGFFWGATIVAHEWDVPGLPFFGGVALIVACIVVAIGLVKSQRDPA